MHRRRRRLLTSFYSWRLIFKTFHGEPHDRQHYDAAHESPLVMLIPLAVPRGRLDPGAGCRSRTSSPARASRNSSADRSTSRPDNHVLEDMHHVPLTVIAMLPTVMMVDRLPRSPGSSTSAGPTSRRAWRAIRAALPLPAQQVVLRRALRRHLRASGDVARPAAVEGRRRLRHRRLRADGVSARVLDVTRNVVRLQTGYLYHYAFAMLIGVAALRSPGSCSRGRTDVELADPLRHHLPAAGRRAVHPCCCSDDEAGRAQRALDRAVDHAGHLRGLADAGVAFRPGLGRNSSSSRSSPGSAAPSATTWASTAFRCRS